MLDYTMPCAVELTNGNEEGILGIVFAEAHPSIFPSEEYIGEGKQARLDLAIDETAVKGKYEPPKTRPQQMPGQTGMED